jgi:hypothetical protein
MTTIPVLKGKWYKSVQYTGGDKRGSGARKRSYLAHGGTQKASGGRRNVLGTGALDLLGLANGVFEENIEEKKILEANNEAKTLIENLRKLEKKDEA